MSTATPQELLGLFAEEARLRVVAALVLGASTPAEVAEAAGLTPRATARALARLTAGGLVTSDSPSSGYRVRTELLRETAARARPELEPGPGGGEAGAVLGRFIRGNKLLSIPTARAKRLLVLDHLAGLFEPGRRYTEAEVNQALQVWHDDFATLRRYLVDEGFLEREDERDPSGTRSLKIYWRAGGSVQADYD